MADVKLSRDKVLELINMYRENQCLWNYKSSNYKRNDLKRNAWKEMAARFNLPMEEIKKKIKSLRSAYVVEKKKVDDSKKSGSSGDVYHPNLFYFGEFNFLDGAIVLRKTCSNFEVSDSLPESGKETELAEGIEATEEFGIGANNSGTTDFEGNNCRTSSVPSSSSKRKKSSRNLAIEQTSGRFDNAIQAIMDFAKQAPPPPPPTQEDDMFTVFAKSVSMQLRNLPELNCTKAMVEVQEVLTKHTIEVLNQRRKQPSSSARFIRVISNERIKQSSNISYSSSSINSDTGYMGTSPRESIRSSAAYRTSTPTLSSSDQSDKGDLLRVAISNADIFDNATDMTL